MAHLITPNAAHIMELMQWFPDAASVAIWSPSNSFPFVREVFIREAKLAELPSFMLVDAGNTPLAFGQYYERHACCHLARLVVAPSRRGEGLGAELVTELCALGTAALATSRCSLFVLAGNEPARKLYRRLGFAEAAYPEQLPLPDCLYMIRECETGM